MNRSITGLLVFWIALLVCPWTLHAQAAEPWHSGLRREFFTAELATALDADNQADWIRAYPCAGPAGSAAFCLRVAVSETRSIQTIILQTNAKGVRVASFDVDGDHLQDVLVVSADDGRPLGIWINDGHGGFKTSDPSLYPASVWHEDPLLYDTSPPERASFASMDGIQDFCLAPLAPNAELPDADQSFSDLEVGSSSSTRFGDHFGRAPPAR